MAMMRLAKFVVVVLVAITIIIIVVEGSEKVAPAVPPVDCTSVITVNMLSCLSYVENGSTEVKPNEKCCAGLKQVLKDNLDCVCQFFQHSSEYNVNVSKALSLPVACHVQPLSPTTCLSHSPIGAPAPTVIPPASTPSTSPVAPPTGAGTSDMSPAPAPAETGSSFVMGISVQLIITGIIAAFSFYF